jgi:Helix-turn-helix domain
MDKRVPFWPHPNRGTTTVPRSEADVFSAGIGCAERGGKGSRKNDLEQGPPPPLSLSLRPLVQRLQPGDTQEPAPRVSVLQKFGEGARAEIAPVSARFLRMRRMRLRLTRLEVARRGGFTSARIVRLENGESVPYMDELDPLGSVLGFSAPEYLKEILPPPKTRTRRRKQP